ncbi:MAG: hypothetical protein KJ799_05555 [Bacteroidetes bacterium]|nr:hypothetical protein [Bacteroidota bacterium]MBU1677444.1 hypothetical protein [Bacteroidota bacterium]MBU2506173.1 hypothetical protein [Bacteroidota bacterium]
MTEFNGILSLLFASIELVFVVNLLFFAEKNYINMLVMLLIFILGVYQVYEFLICFFGMNVSSVVYCAILAISFMPPLGLFIALRLKNFNSKYWYLIFLPALFFVVYFPLVVDQFHATFCTVLYASIHYPLGIYYAAVYYLPIVISLIMYWDLAKSESHPKRKASLKLIRNGFFLTFIPAALLFFLVPQTVIAVESILCKIAFVLALYLFLFALKFKAQYE